MTFTLTEILLEADKMNVQLKKAYDKSNKQFAVLLRKQEQLLRGIINSYD